MQKPFIGSIDSACDIMDTIHLISQARINPRNYIIQAWNRQALAMCIACMKNPPHLCFCTQESNIISYLIHPESAHLPRVAILQPRKTGSCWSSTGKKRGCAKQTSHLPLHVLRMLQLQMPCPSDCQLHSQYPSTTRNPPLLTTSSGKLCGPGSVSANLDASHY